MSERAPKGGPVVVKLGGSLLTRKREAEKVRPKVLARLAGELADAGPIPLVVLHGAGSFGHPGARRFGLAAPPAGPQSVRERTRGAAIVAVEVRRLHLLVLRALVAAGLAPWSVPPGVVAENRDGALGTLDTSPFAAALERGQVPVSFGDVVPDRAWGTSVLSADAIAVELAARLHARRVVFASDVPGILGSDRRSVVPELTESAAEALRPASGAPDVTGGIRAKARAMLAIAGGGTDAVLISGLSDGALSRAVRGEAVYGSWAHARA